MISGASKSIQEYGFHFEKLEQKLTVTEIRLYQLLFLQNNRD